ncbi:hypothetical protein EWH99_12760 [Sporolactobacillus sp. THM7-7]|nr:hypothetical protein EWH99_12760 [Sporolactobacillus sp. THM7-7]
MSIYGRSNMGRLMLIGSLIGGALSLFSRDTRTVWGNRLSTAASGSGKLILTMCRQPDQIGRYFKQTGTHLKTMAHDVSDDFQKMIDHVEQARTSSTNAYQYVMEAGGELGDIAEKLRLTGQSLTRFQEPELVDTETQEALERLENEAPLPNPAASPKE